MSKKEASKFDLIVIGSGTVGSRVASSCRKAGWRVALIDSRRIGGTCMLRGCTPKKVLVGASEALNQFHLFRERNIFSGKAELNWPELIKWKQDQFVDKYAQGRLEKLTNLGIDIFHGEGAFVAKSQVCVNNEILEAPKFCIATGAKPRPLQFPGHESVVTSDDFLNLKFLPKTILFIGGGFVSFELAHVAARAGAKITILEQSPRPLHPFDPDLVELLVDRSKEIGINIVTSSEVVGIEKSESEYLISSKTDNKTRRFSAELVVHGAGRVPNVSELNLSAGGIEFSDKGILVNSFLQTTSNPDVYAGGDVVASNLPLTPVANFHAKIISQNLLQKPKKQNDPGLTPSVVFTTPALASIGLTEEEAKEQELKTQTYWHDMGQWFSVHRLGESRAAAKVIVDKKTDRILGAHLLHPHASDMINVFLVAMKGKLTTKELQDLMLAYPTATSDVKNLIKGTN